MENTSGTIFSKLKEDLTAYLELKLAYYKVCTLEQISRVTAALCYGLIGLFLFFFVNLFIFLAVGLYLGTLFNSLGLGFTCVAIIYLLAILLVYLRKEGIKKFIENRIISLLTEEDNTNHEKTSNS